MNNNNHENKFFEGLLWGAIIGGGIVFLMGTKKGKRLLKTVTEEGMDSLSGLMESVNDVEEGIEEDEIEEEEEIETTNGNGVKDETPKSAKSSVRKRFFRKRSS